ncbi:MAG: hypothetical protein WCO60_01430 [Verrucomicrobiota bacterium]
MMPPRFAHSTRAVALIALAFLNTHSHSTYGELPPAKHTSSTPAQNATSQNATSQNPTSQNATSQNATSQNATSQNATSQNPTSQNPTSQNPTSQNPTSQNPTSQNATSPYVEYQPGELPIIITAPHGGREKPETIPDRPSGTFAFDTNTQELARAIGEMFKIRSGKNLPLVICKLHRTKLDCNREIVEGAAANPNASLAWNTYHNAIESAIQDGLKHHPALLLIDLHGHGHTVQRLEMGYGQGPETLRLEDAALNSAKVTSQSSLAALAKTGRTSHADLIHGPRSLGTLMEKAGFPSTPSSTVPLPPAPYFNGGYTIRTYASAERNVATLQIETNYTGVRDNAASRTHFANTLFDVLSVYLQTHLAINIPTAR